MTPARYPLAALVREPYDAPVPHSSACLADLLARLQAALADRYTIERELGRGGMATVYLAHDLKHERPVALKVLHPELASTLGPERFQREIKLAARLQHPHILTVLDSGEAAGQLWYTMPFVEGESLRERFTRERQLRLDDALQITREVADALGYAHSQGIIHRDIKPENILLSRGHALVADFGVARALQSAAGERLTETGMAVGTPAYMSPEQATAQRDLDARSDIYSLGCVLYEMLAGEPPYTGSSAQAVIAKRLSEPIPHIRTVRESVPEAIEQAVSKALAKAPADRYSSAAEFTRALQAIGPGRGGGADGFVLLRFLRRRPVFAALVVGFVVGVGVLFGWRRLRGGEAGASPTRLAVLPFENLGRPEDEYFADGVSDAVRGKLTALPGLVVIARTSSMQYRKTAKSPRDIAQELGVRYLLTGTVRWAKGPAGRNRVQVTPELIEVMTAGAPESRWELPFDAALTDVFKVQADIASNVAHALSVALGGAEQQALAVRPTDDLAAYDAYLRGEAASQAMNSGDQSSLQRAANLYAQAVGLDSVFGLAWARLAEAGAYVYAVTKPTPAQADATRWALEHAVKLAPGAPETQRAVGIYEYLVRGDATAALQAFEAGLTRAPTNTDLLTSAASAEQVLSRWGQALARLERAQALDPRSVRVARGLAAVLLSLRRWPEARAAAARGLAVAPTMPELIGDQIASYLGEGDLATAQRMLRGVPREVDRAALLYALVGRWDLEWLLDDEQQRVLLSLPLSAFGDEPGQWNEARAETYWFRGDRVRARVYADSARRAFEAMLTHPPERAARTLALEHAFLGLALAFLGRRAAAVHEGQVAVASSGTVDAYVEHQLARIYILVGQPDRALDQLELLLRVPYILSPGWLRIDPNFAPLRGNPRFERLAAGR